MLLLMLLLIQRTAVEGLQVIGGNMTVVQGETVVLPCKLIDAKETLTQISWQRKTRGKPQLDNFYTIVPNDGPKFVNGGDERFKFIGSTNDYNGSLQLSDVTLLDEGIYTCIYTLFPSGHYTTEIPLNVLVPPVTSVKDNHPALDTEEVSLVTCTAAGSKPPAEVRWITDSLGEKVKAITNSTTHDNGTTTTVSSLLGIPTREINRHLVQCVITIAAQSKEETLNITVRVYYSPMEVNIQERDKNSFECMTDASPDATFTWSRSNNSWPGSAVRAENGKLQFLSMTWHVNGLYQCEASNAYGTKRGVLYMNVPYGNCALPWTLFVLLLLLNIAVVLWHLYKCWKSSRLGDDQSNHRQTGEEQNLPTEREEPL